MKFRFLTLALLCVFSLNAQGPWSQRATMPGLARHRAFTFSIGQRGYFGCGWNGVTMYDDFWEYDPGTDMWTQKANYPGGPRLSAFGFTVGNKGYAGTGLDEFLVAQSDFYQYDPGTNQWTMKAAFTGVPVFGATATAWNTSGLVLFGDDWDPNYFKHNEIYAYNTLTDVWTYVGQFPGDGRRDHVAFNIGNKIYFGTGNDNSYVELNDWWEWDPGTGIMTAKAGFIGSARSQAVGFAVGGKGYVGTGGALDERDFYQYNPQTNSWQGINDFPGAGRENSMSFVIGTRAFLIAGTSGINYHDCWEFDPGLVTGTDESENAASAVKVWPVPAVDVINIDLQAPVSGTVTYQIYNISGQLAEEAVLPVSGPVIQIPVNQLPNGAYSLVITGAGRTWQTRFTR